MRDWAARQGYFIGTAAPQEAVTALLRRFWPVTTTLPLIRVGGAADGGYLVPDDLDGIAACFSPGVDVTATFEKDMIARGIPCFLADASVESAPLSDPLVDFERSFLGTIDEAPLTTMDDWVRRKGPASGDLLLQMDIEGHEWPVLLSMSEQLLTRFRIMVLEIHGLPDAFNSSALEMFDSCMMRLNRHFHVVHSHVNNFLPATVTGGLSIPPFLEITLLRKDRADATGMATNFPHPLDQTNVPGLPDYVLPASMHATG